MCPLFALTVGNQITYLEVVCLFIAAENVLATSGGVVSSDDVFARLALHAHLAGRHPRVVSVRRARLPVRRLFRSLRNAYCGYW